MDQRSIFLFLALKGLSAPAVDNELTAVLGADAIAYSTVPKYLSQRQFTSILVALPEEPATIVVDQATLDPLEQYPLSSIQGLARFTGIPTTTVHRHLTQSYSSVVKHLRWVPRTLMPTQKTERVTLSIEFLRQPRSIEHHGWQFIITLDESWFYLSTDPKQVWLRVEAQPPERLRHTIEDPRIMVTIAWNPLGFHLLDALPKGSTFNAEYYRVNILTELLPLRPQVDRRGIGIYADGGKPHTARKCRPFCEENRPRLAIHPPHSPDLAPSDFFLFAHIKHYLQGIAVPSRE
jgi:hypothetical protein